MRSGRDDNEIPPDVTRAERLAAEQHHRRIGDAELAACCRVQHHHLSRFVAVLPDANGAGRDEGCALAVTVWNSRARASLQLDVNIDER